MFLIGGGIPISALELLDVSSERVYFPLSADYHGFGECNLGFFQPPSQQWHFSWVYKHPHLKIFHNPGEKLATWAGGQDFLRCQLDRPILRGSWSGGSGQLRQPFLWFLCHQGLVVT